MKPTVPKQEELIAAGNSNLSQQSKNNDVETYSMVP